MRHWLLLKSYHWSVLILMLALSASVAGWVSFGLINIAMANFDFVSRHGATALREGGLVQMVGIGLRGAVVLAAYLLFKAVETELIARWRNAGR